MQIAKCRAAFLGVCLMVFAGAGFAAEVAKAHKKAKAPRAPLREKLTCSSGPLERQARLIAEVVKGRPMEFAYYSRLDSRVCSIHGRRGDAYTKWIDLGSGRTAVTLLTGNAQLEYRPGHLQVSFEDVERMRYCGTDGELNGRIEVSSKKRDCGGLEGVFDY